MKGETERVFVIFTSIIGVFRMARIGRFVHTQTPSRPHVLLAHCISPWERHRTEVTFDVSVVLQDPVLMVNIGRLIVNSLFSFL